MRPHPEMAPPSAPSRAAASLSRDLAALDAEPLAGAGGLAMARRRAEAVDRTIRALFPPVDRLALAALGGYGRSELVPGSDLDLVILHAEGVEAEAEEAFASVLYPLWDLGISVGHAVRTPQECGEEAGRRVESVTALLDARLLAGSSRLLEGALAVVAAAVRADPAWLLDELRAGLVQREVRFGILGESLEPDVRDSVGGLRDVQMVGWLARGLLGGDEDGLVSRGWLRPAERAWIGGALDALLAVRTALHRVAGRRVDRLSAHHQGPVAEALGFRDVDGPPPVRWEGRDDLMRTVFDHGRRVRAAAESCLDRAGADLLARRGHVVTVRRDRSAPEAVVEAFARLAEQGGSLAPADLDSIQAGRLAGPGGAVPEPWTDQMREAFVRILASGEGGVRALGLLDLLGVLTALLPEWAHVRGRSQRDPFHRFPADTHLARTAAHLARLLLRPDDPLAGRSVASVVDPGPLLIAGLLHDIGKVGAGSHVVEGARAAEAIAARMGLSERQRDAVLFLVREHLLLSDTATRRNIEDPDLVLHVAARVGDPDRLAALSLLTLADAESTGPSAATPWRLGLIRDLVAKVSRAFERGEMSPGRAARLEHAEAELRAALVPTPPDDVEAFLAQVPPAYVLWADPSDGPVHLRLVHPRPGRVEARSHHRPGRSRGLHLLTVGALDRPGLLAHIAGALTLAGFTVLSAQAFTTEDGVALDAFEVAGAFEEEVAEDRWRRFRRFLRHALEGRVDLADRIRDLRTHYRPASEDVPVTVRVDQEGSDYFTIVEVGAADRLGLLFDLARTFADRGLDVHLAKVATYGPRVVDVFYVTNAAGEKVTAGAAALAEELRTAVAQG